MPARSLRLLFVCLCVSVPGLVAADEKPDEKIDPSKMTDLAVLLQDEDGKPVAGAEVMPYAMRMKEQSGHGYWDRKVYGAPKHFRSNDEGIAVIKYPPHVQSGPDVLTTKLVSFQITHTDFIRKIVDFDLGPERAEVQLKPGCEVRLSAVDPEGKRVENFGVVVAGPYQPEKWAKDGEGGRRTRSISDGTWQTMLVKLQDDGPTLFSDVLPLRVRPKQTVQFRNIRLSPGARLRGRLSANVPRPVKRGYVVTTSVPQPAGNSYDDKDPSLVWHDWVDVAEDGTFEFASLPRGGEVQLIAVCDGWVSTTTVPDANQVFVMGQLFDIDKDVVDVELQMEATGTLRVEVTTKDGKPLTEGSVAAWPNQSYYKGGSTVLGQKYRSDWQIKNQLLPRDQQLAWPDWARDLPFMQPLDKNGVAVLTGIPVGKGEQVALQHDKLKLQTKNGAENRSGNVSFRLPSTDPVVMKVTAAPAKE